VVEQIADDDDRVFQEILKDPKVAGIVRDARLFDSLRTNEAWKRLHQLVEAKKERWMRTVAERFMGPQRNWPKPEEIAYYQGFYYGAQFVLRHPEHAEHSLERAATLAWAMLQERAEEAEG
jgi:hypothetical protein